MRRFLLVFLLISALSSFAQPSDVGDVAFANSGKAEAQATFLRGLALLHNFEYPTAAEMFRKAQELDPAFAMAYWGEAMTYTHPVWFQQDAEAARAALQRLGATPAERRAKAPTEREKDYLRAVDVLYGEGAKNDRDFLFAEAMASLHARYPDDVDATAFYALSLLGTAHEGRDFAIYMRAASLLEEVFPAHLHHPGVLHYLIHSYDDPVHAPLGMRAARLYGAVAPDAGHALHMTSHIFVAMGMWDDVIDANRRAIAVVNRQRAERSKPNQDCGHYPTWLHYALLQKGKFDEARKALELCRASAFPAKFESAGPGDSRQNRLDAFAEMRAAQVASGQPSGDAVTIAADVDAPGARFTIAYGDALAAAQRGDAVALKAAVATLHALHGDVAAKAAQESNPSYRIRAEVMVAEADALQLIAAGKSAEAIAILEEAAKGEKSMPFEFGPPVVPKPVAELLADQLLGAGRAADAVAAYRSVLQRTPGRTATLEALARAQKSAGQAAAAQETPAAPHVH
jgi:tetratricopeptide (TPR) repeat protein